MKVYKYVCPKCGNDEFKIFNADEFGYEEDLIIVCTKCNTNRNEFICNNNEYEKDIEMVITDKTVF